MIDTHGSSTEFTAARVRRTALAQLPLLDAYHDMTERVLSRFDPAPLARLRGHGGRGSIAGLNLTVIDDEHTPPAAVQQHCAVLAESLGVWAQWQRHRVVYSLDPDLMTELADTGPEAYSRADLTQVPHDNPLLLLPQPIAVEGTGFGYDEPCHVFAIGVTGYDHTHDRYRGFSDPTRTHVQWSIHVSLPDEDELNVSTVHQLTPPLPDPAAMTQVDTEVLALRHDAVAPARAVAQAALAYLCAEPDIAPANTMRRPARTAGPAAPKQRSKAATLFGVGYRVGPTLPGRRRERRDHTEHLDHTATRRSPEPHPRRSHTRTLADGTTVRVRSTRVNAHLDPGRVIDATVMAVTTRHSDPGSDAALAARPAHGAATDPGTSTDSGTEAPAAVPAATELTDTPGCSR